MSSKLNGLLLIEIFIISSFIPISIICLSLLKLKADFFPPPLLLEIQEPSSRREWRTDTTSTASWSIFSPSTSARDTPTPASGNGWSTSTGTLTARTWDILTCSTTSPWPRTRAKRASASTWWRRCCSHVDPLRTNLTMPRSERAASLCLSSDVLMRFLNTLLSFFWSPTQKNAVFVWTTVQRHCRTKKTGHLSWSLDQRFYRL